MPSRVQLRKWRTRSTYGRWPLGQMDSHVRATPQVTVYQEFFSLSEISDAGSVTSQFYEDGSVNFSDTPPPVTLQSSHAQCHTSDVTCQASQQPDQPLPAQQNRGTPRNRPANTSPPSTSTPDVGTSSRGCVCTMTCAMADSIDQRSFFGSLACTICPRVPLQPATVTARSMKTCSTKNICPFRIV